MTGSAAQAEPGSRVEPTEEELKDPRESAEVGPRNWMAKQTWRCAGPAKTEKTWSLVGPTAAVDFGESYFPIHHLIM